MRIFRVFPIYSLVLALLSIALPRSSATAASLALNKPFLNLPPDAAGAPPALLSQTAAFDDTSKLIATGGLLPYGLNVPFWSDGASKTRWVAIPRGGESLKDKVIFSPATPWIFPAGTVFVKHFEIATDETRPEIRRRLETRFLVRDNNGGVYGITYKWRADNSDAELLPGSLNEAIPIQTTSGIRTQIWYYPSRDDCKTCHTPLNGGVLGVNTRQLNCEFEYSPTHRNNQLAEWNQRNLFDSTLATRPTDYPSLAKPDDLSRSIEDRARSWLDANCAHCHRPGGTVVNFDTRFEVPLPEQHLINGEVLIDEGLDNARAIAPRDLWRSMILFRVNTVDANRMPPLAHNRIDETGVKLLKQWINSLPGPPVLEPPQISPPAGRFSKPVSVKLSHPEPGAEMHYTLDGSAPNKSDPIYDGSLAITNTCVVRVKAFKPGFTKSITVQQVYVISER